MSLDCYIRCNSGSDLVKLNAKFKVKYKIDAPCEYVLRGLKISEGAGLQVKGVLSCWENEVREWVVKVREQSRCCENEVDLNQ